MKNFLGLVALLIVGAAIGSFITFAKYPLLSGYLHPQNAAKESAAPTAGEKTVVLGCSDGSQL